MIRSTLSLKGETYVYTCIGIIFMSILLSHNPFFFCHYVFQKLSAAEASKGIYMRERANDILAGNYTCVGNNTLVLLYSHVIKELTENSFLLLQEKEFDLSHERRKKQKVLSLYMIC